jgi:hypothetical protein
MKSMTNMTRKAEDAGDMMHEAGPEENSENAHR